MAIFEVTDESGQRLAEIVQPHMQALYRDVRSAYPDHAGDATTVALCICLGSWMSQQPDTESAENAKQTIAGMLAPLGFRLIEATIRPSASEAREFHGIMSGPPLDDADFDSELFQRIVRECMDQANRDRNWKPNRLKREIRERYYAIKDKH